MKMSTLTFDQLFFTAVGISSVVMVLSGCWIIRVLIQIEKSKVVALATVLEDDGTGTNDLEFEESTTGKHLEVEKADGSPSGGAIEMSPTGKSKKQQEMAPSPEPSPTGKPMTARKVRQKQRRISWAFINIQIVSVLVLILLTYLLLVQSNAVLFLRMLGSLCVFGVFLRFQIGEEVRRQRVDRLMLLLSLFLLIASMLSTLVYSMKTLKQGEIYAGPARIVGYSLEQYNNTQHDPTIRTDVAVSWGKDWGCPLSGGKVCQANIPGAMCQTHPDKSQTKHKPNYGSRQRFLEDGADENDEKVEEAEEEEEALEEDLEDEEKDNQDLEEQNEELAAENEKLEQEIEELKEENEVEDEENQELVDQENSALNEVADEYDEDILYMEEVEEEDEQDYVDAEYEEDEEKLQYEIDAATDDEKKEELEEDLEEDVAEKDDVDEEYEEEEEEIEEYEDEFAEYESEDYDEFVEEQEETEELDEEKEELKEEVEETEEEINEGDYSTSSKGEDDVYQDVADEAYDEEEAEIEEEYYEEEEEWYWDEYPSSYDDDMFADEYWTASDWSSAWGEYACEDLFDADISGQSYDPDTPAGEDEWPVITIYGSCKSCHAYFFQEYEEDAFEELQEYRNQAIVYLAGAVAGFVWSLLSYIKYRAFPTAENEIAFLGNDGGVLA